MRLTQIGKEIEGLKTKESIYVDENKQKSKKFDIETYEPTNDNNNIDELFEKKERGNEPEDSLNSDFRKPIIPKVNKEDINDEIGPRDSKRKKQNNNNNKN